MHPSRRTFMAGIAGLLALTIGAVAPPVHAASTKAAEIFSARSSDGTVLSVEAQGDPAAPEILFIHGLRQSRLSWEKQLADPQLKGFRIVTFDLRGHGDSDKPAAPGAYSSADLWADDVAAVIGAAKLRRPVLVGWSLGGYVAGAYVRKYGGGAIAGVNLVDAVTKLSPDLLTKESVAFTTTTTSPDLAIRADATADFLATCFYRQPTKAEMRQMLIVNGMTARAVNEGFVQTKTTDLEPTFQSYAGPILLTHGIHDRLVQVAMSERIKAIHPGARLSLFSDSGHSPFFEEPARYGKELAAFVKAANQG